MGQAAVEWASLSVAGLVQPLWSGSSPGSQSFSEVHHKLFPSVAAKLAWPVLQTGIYRLPGLRGRVAGVWRGLDLNFAADRVRSVANMTARGKGEIRRGRGVIFDMDGTLTIPVIAFSEMRFVP